MNSLEANVGILNRRHLLLGASAGLMAACTKTKSEPNNPDWAALESAVNNFIADKRNPGASASVMRNGRLVYSRGFGLANMETNTPMSPDTVFKIGSISKQFATAALLILQEEGRLSLDHTLDQYIPDFPRADEITLRQMSNHTSGLGDYTNYESHSLFEQAARTDYDEDALLDVMRATNPLFVHEPGAAYAYSNTAFVLLGIVIARVTGAPYGEFLQNRVIAPAGLTQTSVDNAADIVVGRASGYSPSRQAPTGFVNANFISMTFPGAAGALRSTTPELCKWHRALLSGDVLRPESLKEMLTPGRTTNGDLPKVQRRTPDGQTKMIEIESGLGIGVNSSDETFAGRRTVSHSGGIFGFSCYLQSFPDEDLSFALAINADGGDRDDFPAAVTTLRKEVSLIALG